MRKLALFLAAQLPVLVLVSPGMSTGSQPSGGLKRHRWIGKAYLASQTTSRSGGIDRAGGGASVEKAHSASGYVSVQPEEQMTLGRLGGTELRVVLPDLVKHERIQLIRIPHDRPVSTELQTCHVGRAPTRRADERHPARNQLPDRVLYGRRGRSRERHLRLERLWPEHLYPACFERLERVDDGRLPWLDLDDRLATDGIRKCHQPVGLQLRRPRPVRRICENFVKLDDVLVGDGRDFQCDAVAIGKLDIEVVHPFGRTHTVARLRRTAEKLGHHLSRQRLSLRRLSTRHQWISLGREPDATGLGDDEEPGLNPRRHQKRLIPSGLGDSLIGAPGFEPG